MPKELKTNAEAIEFLLNEIPGTVRLGVPLGLGKPNKFLNDLTESYRHSPERKLEIYTALSLDPPRAENLLAKRFYGPFFRRHLGENYPRLDYLQEDKLPANIRVHEFYLQAGQAKPGSKAQKNYISLNYTHAARDILGRGLNAIVQLVSRAPGGALSLSCNPDTSIDIDDLARRSGRRVVKIAVVHPGLPFLGGDAEVSENFFDAVLDSAENSHELFALPRLPIDPASHAVAFRASTLVEDGGTLQIGIGSLSEALTHSLLLRHQQNETYTALVKKIGGDPASLTAFRDGLFGLSEMVMDSFMHLRRGGILRREVRLEGGQAIFLQGGFFLGSKPFYAWLNSLSEKERSGIFMSRISKVNDLYDPNETEVRRQRPKARFFNTAMGVNLLGGVMSDTLPNGAVVSGVGGQYNFVAMGQELKCGRAVILFRSTRDVKGRAVSNISLGGGHLTVPRHLRDLVVNEYGVAELRGKTDEECVEAMIAIADSRFQGELAEQAKKAGKLNRNYHVPESARQNYPEKIREIFGAARGFPAYPFGSDFTASEEILVAALERLARRSRGGLLRSAVRSGPANKFTPELERMGFTRVRSWKERLLRRALLAALNEA